MRLERGNLVRITDDEVKIAKFKEEGYKEVEEVNEEKKAKEAEVETAEADKEAKEVEVAEADKEKKTTGRGRTNNNKK